MHCALPSSSSSACGSSEIEDEVDVFLVRLGRTFLDPVGETDALFLLGGRFVVEVGSSELPRVKLFTVGEAVVVNEVRS